MRAVGLDVDGVMRDTGYPAYQFLCKSLTKLGAVRVPTFDEFVREYSHNLVEFCQKYGVSCTNEEYMEVYRGYSNGHHDVIKPFDDVLPTIEYLNALGLEMFAVSSHTHDAIEQWFDTHGLASHFAHVAGSSVDKTAALRLMCDKIAIKPRQACYVGDWGADMRSATEAGLLPIGITRGYESRAELVASGAMHVIDHLHELADSISVQ